MWKPAGGNMECLPDTGCDFGDTDSARIATGEEDLNGLWSWVHGFSTSYACAGMVVLAAGVVHRICRRVIRRIVPRKGGQLPSRGRKSSPAAYRESEIRVQHPLQHAPPPV